MWKRNGMFVLLSTYRFFQIGRFPLLLVRFLFFNITSESSFQSIPRGMNLIQSHSYEVLIRISLNRRIKSWNCQSFKLGINFHGMWKRNGMFVLLSTYRFFQIGRFPLLLVRFLFFNITSESSFQSIPRGMNLIQSHSYEVLIRISLNRRIKSWNCQSFKLGFGDDKFLFWRYFGDKFSFGVVNFHSVGRLTVNYLTERSMRGNFNDSEHLLGLTEEQKILRQFP